METLTTQLAILGGGPAGYVAAIRASQLGAEVTLVEKRDLGGVCLNRGCIPTKALLQSARVAAAVCKSAEFGVRSKIETIDWETVVSKKNRVVKSLHTGLSSVIAAQGIEVIQGEGTMITPTEIRVETRQGPVTIKSETTLLATGTTPAIPSIPGY